MESRPLVHVALGCAASAIAVLLALIAFDADISAARFFSNDVLFRSAALDVHPYRSQDASPYSIWIPSNTHVRSSLLRGELPVWDRTQGGGYTPLGRFQNGIFFPLRWAMILIPERQAPSALMLFTACACFVGMFACARQLAMRDSAAALAAGLFTFAPWMLAMSTFEGVIVFMFLPWTMWAVLTLLSRPTYALFARLALIGALAATAGHPLYLVSTLLALLFSLAPHLAFVRGAPRTLLAVVLAAPAAMLLAAFALLPFALELSASWTYKLEGGAPYEPFGIGDWFTAVAAIGASFPEPMIDHARFYGWLGAPMVVLALLGLVTAKQKLQLRFLWIALPVGFLIAVPGPWMAPLAHVPPISFIQVWYLYVLFLFPAALAAGAGFEMIAARVRMLSRAPIAAVVILLLIAQGPIRAGDLFAPVKAPWLWPSQGFALLASTREPFRVMSPGGQTHAPNLSAISDIEDLGVVGPMLDQRYHLWFLAADPKVLTYNYGTSRTLRTLESELIGRFNVKYLINGRVPFGFLHSAVEPNDPFAIIQPFTIRNAKWPLVYEDDFVQIFENRGVYKPRAYAADRLQIVRDADEALRVLTERPSGVDVVECASGCDRLARHTPAATATITVEYPAHTAVHLRSQTSADALLVLADAHHRGWTAELDGARTDIFAVNLFSRGVFVPAGAHEVIMRFSAPGLFTGAVISLLALVALIAAGFVRRGAKAP
jgi:hypothetical protein